MKSAPISPIIIVGAFVLPDTMYGMLKNHQMLITLNSLFSVTDSLRDERNMKIKTKKKPRHLFELTAAVC